MEPPDSGGLDRQLEQLRPRLAAAVARVCPPWMRSRAEDIVQNALIQLLGLLRADEGDREFSSIYIRKLAYGATVDEIRRHNRRRESQKSLDRFEQASSGVAGPERRVRSLEAGNSIRSCLAGLGPDRRRAVTLYLAGCSVPEVARRMDWTRKRAENLVYRGLADLRGCLVEKGWR